MAELPDRPAAVSTAVYSPTVSVLEESWEMVRAECSRAVSESTSARIASHQARQSSLSSTPTRRARASRTRRA
ncbi:hypothetical protein ACTG9Q_07005 [Actinokineospora sp. 24-640]